MSEHEALVAKVAKAASAAIDALVDLALEPDVDDRVALEAARTLLGFALNEEWWETHGSDE